MHAKSIYDIDDTEIMKAAHKNALLKDVYDKFPEIVGKKNVDILLYTRYTKGMFLDDIEDIEDFGLKKL